MLAAQLMYHLKQALKTHQCALCGIPLPFNAEYNWQWFCNGCQKSLGIGNTSLNNDASTPTDLLDLNLTACKLNPVLKHKLYGFKFYGKKQNSHLLTGVLNHYWQSQVLSLQNNTCPAFSEVFDLSSVLVTVIPSHGNTASHMVPVAKAFAHQWRYHFDHRVFSWRRSVKPQHQLHHKHHRMNNVIGALQPAFNQWDNHTAIIIVDDLLTTGATVAAARQAIKETGQFNGRRVIGLTVAFTPM
ncbi:MAG: hypothetical protein AAGI66_03130 [Cyanobacteria bacterium P01_H01_bin.74]